MSLQRYWSFQLLAASVPSIIFIVYGSHALASVQDVSKITDNIRNRQQKDVEKFKAKIKKSKHRKLHLSETDLQLPENVNDQKVVQDEDIRKIYKNAYDGNIPFRKNIDAPSKVIIVYFWSLIFKILIDVGFTVGQWFIYPYHGWMVESYDCVDTHPCNAEVVSCWPIRPFEKSLFIWLWYATTVVTVLFATLELVEMGCRTLYYACKHQTSSDITKMNMAEQGMLVEMRRNKQLSRQMHSEKPKKNRLRVSRKLIV